MSTLGDRIHLARRQRDINQAVLARSAGISPTYLSEIERGKTGGVSVDIVVSLANVLGVSVPYLLGLSDAQNTADDGAPTEASSARLVFEIRDDSLRAAVIEIVDTLRNMTPAQRRLFVEMVLKMRRLIEHEENNAPIIIE